MINSLKWLVPKWRMLRNKLLTLDTKWIHDANDAVVTNLPSDVMTLCMNIGSLSYNRLNLLVDKLKCLHQASKTGCIKKITN